MHHAQGDDEGVFAGEGFAAENGVAEAALDTLAGMADHCTPDNVSPIETNNAPMNQGLVRPIQSISPAPAAVANAKPNKPGHWGACGACSKRVSTCRPQ